MKKSTIYGVKTGDTFHYIGKTVKESKKDNGELCNSDACYQYFNPAIRNVFLQNADVNVVSIKTVDDDQWFGEKLQEVIKKHQDNNPLLNAQWMLEGKRSYWDGKERDAHTLKRLSESKYKRVCQYVVDGPLLKLMRIWDSGKEIGLQVFKDYKVVKGAGCTKVYRMLDSRRINSRLKYGSYWFREAELLARYNLIPKKINLQTILAEERQRMAAERKETVHTSIWRYKIEQLNDKGEVIKTYDNYLHAAYVLRISKYTVQKICRGLHYPLFKLQYGERTLQPYLVEYPKYTIIPYVRPKKTKEEKVRIKKEKAVQKYQRTRTKYTVIQFNKEGEVIDMFTDVQEAADTLKIHPNYVRLVCKGNELKNCENIFLKYGGKMQVNID